MSEHSGLAGPVSSDLELTRKMMPCKTLVHRRVVLLVMTEGPMVGNEDSHTA